MTSGRYISRWEAAEIAKRMRQVEPSRSFGATRGLASEAVRSAQGTRHGRQNIGATAPGLPGGEGVWGRIEGRKRLFLLLPHRNQEWRPTQPAWFRSEKLTNLDARGARDHELQPTLKSAWEQGFDAVQIRNYSTKAGPTGDIVVVRDGDRNLLASLAGALGIGAGQLAMMDGQE